MREFRILGALEVASNGRLCTPTAPKVRQVVALLALCSNQVVNLDSLIAELWDDSPPRSAVVTTQSYIYRMRKLLGAEEKPEEPGGELLVTKTSGYMLQVTVDEVDASVFQRLVLEGNRYLEGGRPDAAARVLHQALDLWHGPALADVTRGRILEPYAVLLEEQRLRALELRIQADLKLGLQRELIGELKSLVTRHPLNEWFHGQLIAALNHVGRRSEALQAYQNLRAILNEELGLDPTPELQRLQQVVLNGDHPRVSAPDRQGAVLALS